MHHGFHGKGFFEVTGTKGQRVKLLLQHEISLFGIHLPLDAHPVYGNDAQLFSYLDADITEPYAVGFSGKNTRGFEERK